MRERTKLVCEQHLASLRSNQDQRLALAACQKCPICYSIEITVSWENREKGEYTCKDCHHQFNHAYRGFKNNLTIHYSTDDYAKAGQRQSKGTIK